MGAEEVAEMLQGLEQLSCGERLRGLGVFSMEKGRKAPWTPQSSTAGLTRMYSTALRASSQCLLSTAGMEHQLLPTDLSQCVTTPVLTIILPIIKWLRREQQQAFHPIEQELVHPTATDVVWRK